MLNVKCPAYLKRRRPVVKNLPFHACRASPGAPQSTDSTLRPWAGRGGSVRSSASSASAVSCSAVLTSGFSSALDFADCTAKASFDAPHPIEFYVTDSANTALCLGQPAEASNTVMHRILACLQVSTVVQFYLTQKLYRLPCSGTVKNAWLGHVYSYMARPCVLYANRYMGHIRSYGSQAP